MSAQTTHIIKRDDVVDARVMRPDPSLLQRSLKIPRKHVEMTSESDDVDPSARRHRRVRGENAELAGESFEIYTREMERTRRTESQRDQEASEGDEATIEEIEARWQTRLEDEVSKAREEGFNAGKASNQSEMEQTIREAASTLAQNLDAVRQAWEDHLNDSQIRLVQLAFRIARVVLDAPLPADVRRISEAAITDAIEGMVDGVPVDVAVHPVSYLRLQEAGLEEQLRAVHGKLRWRSDPTLKENEWIVQSDRSATRRLEVELLDDLQRDLSLRDLPSDESDADPSDLGPSGDHEVVDPEDSEGL